MKLTLVYLSLLVARVVVLNKQDDRPLSGVEIKHEDSIEMGKGQGLLEDLKVDLVTEEDFSKFEKVANIPLVPEGMAEVSRNIENFVTDEIEEMKKGERFFLIFFVDEKTALLPAAHAKDRLMKVFISTDRELAESMNTPFPGIYGFNPSDKVSYQFPLTEEIVKVVSPIVNVDLIGMLTYQNLEMYKSTGLHSYYVFIKPADIEKFIIDFKEKAKALKHLGKFCLIPYQGDKSQLSVFGLTEEDLPGILFIKDGDKYPLKKCMENDVLKFVQDVMNEEIEPIYSSQEEPENNDELEVKVFTRNNLTPYKNDTTKDKLVIFTSPSCNFCIQLRPVIEELGKIAKENFDDKLVVGTCDITLNDVTDFDTSSVPRIFLIKGETGMIIQYESRDRSAKSIAEFIKEDGTFKTDLTPFITVDSEEIKSEIPAEKAAEVSKDARDL